MDENYQQTEAAIYNLAILTHLLESDPEIIDSLPEEEVSADLLEMGIDPQPPAGFAELTSKGIEGITPEIEFKITALSDAVRDEIFEDGMENELTRGLALLLNQYGDDTLKILSDLIKRQKLNDEIASEVLRWLSRIDHSSSYDMRLSLLEQSLGNASARLRDAAVSGLAYLDDEHAIPYLSEAIKKELIAELRDDMEQALNQLEVAG